MTTGSRIYRYKSSNSGQYLKNRARCFIRPASQRDGMNKNNGIDVYKCLKRSIALIILFLFSISTGRAKASASGYAVFTQSSSSLGQAAAVVSHTDSPSTIFFNPALMNKLEGTQVEIGTTLLFPTREFKSDATGKSCETKDDVFYPSTLYLTHRFNATVSAGSASSIPSAWNDWAAPGEGRTCDQTRR